MKYRVTLLIFVIFGAGCANIAEPKVTVCVKADKDANLEQERAIPLPTPIAFETAEKEIDIESLLSVNIVNKESKNKDYIYPNTVKCMNIRHSRKDTIVAVFALFNNNRNAIDRIVQRIPMGFPKRNIWLKISRNKIHGG